MKNTIALFALVLAAGCAGEPEPEPVEGEDPEGCPEECIEGFEEKTCNSVCLAPYQCLELTDLLCERVSDVCDATFNECKNLYSQVYPCDSIAGVSDRFAECLADVDRIEECGDENPLSCRGVMLLANGEPESCEDMAERWVCTNFSAGVPVCELDGEPTPIPICVCPEEFIRTGENECTRSCASQVVNWTCQDNAVSTCLVEAGEPACVCEAGFVAVNGACVETCQHKVDSAPPNWCSNYPNTEAACMEPQSTTEDPLCYCIDGYRLVRETFDDPNSLLCVQDICVVKQPYWTCIRADGTPDPNCNCNCDSATAPSDDPMCFCNMGYTYNAGAGECVLQ